MAIPLHRRTQGSVLALALAFTALGAGCGGETGPADRDTPTPAPAPAEVGPDTVVLVVDGMEITAAEIHEFDDFVRGFDPAAGRDALARMVLTSYVLPMRAAKRRFADRWEALRQEAQQLSERCAGDGYPGLAEIGPLHDGYAIGPKTRGGLDLPAARWAFAKENLYAVSPALEVVSGFQVIAAYDYHDELANGLDTVDVYVVPFPVADRNEYNAWWTEERARLATRCTWVHPDYRSSLPIWLAAPP